MKGTVIGITGTNGKSTVTTLVGEMCKATGRPTFVGGNLGTPLVDVVGTEAAQANGFVVVELSSFQLERVEQLPRPRRRASSMSPTITSTATRASRTTRPPRGDCSPRQRKADHAVAPAGDALCISLARRVARHAAPVRRSDGSVRVEAERCAISSAA